MPESETGKQLQKKTLALLGFVGPIFVWTFHVLTIYKMCMSPTRRLSPEDKEFFRDLAEAAATNPFSEVYVELQRKIAGGGSAARPGELLGPVVERVTDKVRSLEAAGFANVNLFAPDDRELLRRAFLFDHITIEI